MSEEVSTQYYGDSENTILTMIKMRTWFNMFKEEYEKENNDYKLTLVTMKKPKINNESELEVSVAIIVDYKKGEKDEEIYVCSTAFPEEEFESFDDNKLGELWSGIRRAMNDLGSE